MKPSVLFTVVVLGLCGPRRGRSQPPRDGSYEGLVKDMLDTVDQITKVLVTIKDRECRRAARPELKKSAEKMLDLRKQAAEWKQPNKEEKDRLEKEYAPKLRGRRQETPRRDDSGKRHPRRQSSRRGVGHPQGQEDKKKAGK